MSRIVNTANADALRAEQEARGDDPAPKPVVKVVLTGALRHELVRLSEDLLLAEEPPAVFDRAGKLFRIVARAPATAREKRLRIERPEGSLVLRPVDQTWLAHHLSETGAFVRRSKKKGETEWTEHAADCPESVTRGLLSLSGEWRLPGLTGIVTAPTLRPDGSLLSTPGWDEETGIFLAAGATDFPPIPEKPGKDEAIAALGELKDLVRAFPFVDPSDRSTSVAAMLTAVVRRVLRSSPLFTYSAPAPRSGKTLLAELAALVATGRKSTTVPFSNDRQEERKKILSILLAGDLCVTIDNVEDGTELRGSTLCIVLTAETFSDRVLGANETDTAPTNVMWSATGNNLAVAADLASRRLVCEIDPEMERPEERTFAVNLEKDIPARQGELLTAALTVLRAYHAAGLPSQGIPEWGGFEEWSAWIRGALVWLDEEDPYAGRKKAESADPDRQRLAAILHAWPGLGQPKTSAELVVASNVPANASLRDALMNVAGVKDSVNTQKLGTFLGGKTGRIVDGLHLEKLKPRDGLVRWQATTAKKSRGTEKP